jgi:hypothetical protein
MKNRLAFRLMVWRHDATSLTFILSQGLKGSLSKTKYLRFTTIQKQHLTDVFTGEKKRGSPTFLVMTSNFSQKKFFFSFLRP